MNLRLTEFELTVEALPAPANLVAANAQLSTGLLQASTDQGALSYNLWKKIIGNLILLNN